MHRAYGAPSSWAADWDREPCSPPHHNRRVLFERPVWRVDAFFPFMADTQTRRQSARVAQKQKRSLDAPSEEAEAPAPKQTKTSTPATKPLRVGDTLPSVELVDQDGKTVNVGDLRKVVIFTYPKVCKGQD